MGVASYSEDLLAAFYERTQTEIPRLRPPLHRCPFCSAGFDDRSTLLEHLSAQHRGERPILRISGREPSANSIIRQSIHSDDIEVLNCTSINIKENGDVRSDQRPDTLSDWLVPATDAIVEVQLVNKFDPAAAAITQAYRLALTIPDNAALDAVDHDFREMLARDALDMSDIGRFLNHPSTQGTARDYADGLASYVRGVLVRDRAGGATLPVVQAYDLYGAAQETLSEFHRPLSVVICGLVRFAFNNFSLIEETTGFHRLDRCCTVLAPAASCTPPATPDNAGEAAGVAGRTVSLCPVDRALDGILDLVGQSGAASISQEDCRRALEQPRLTARDEAKIYALHALAALQSNAADEARDSLRWLRNQYPFGPWASSELARLDE